MLYLLVCGMVSLIFSYLFWKLSTKPFNYWQEKGVRCIQPLFPVGNMQAYKKPFVKLIDDIYNLYPNSRYVGTSMFLDPILIVRDLELIKEISIKDFESFTNHRQLVPDDVDPLWNSILFSLRDDKWRSMRSTLTPVFSSTKIRYLFHLIQECSEELANYLSEISPSDDNTIEVEFRDVLKRFASDVIARTAFGIKVNSLVNRNNEFYVNSKNAVLTNTTLFKLKIFFISMCPALAKYFNIKIIANEVVNHFTSFITDLTGIRKKENIEHPDLIYTLLKAKEQNGEELDIKLTDDDIVAQAFVFFFAGFDSELELLTFTIYELALNSDVQSKLLNEINEALKHSKGKVTYEMISDMKYLHMVISETTRKWSPTPVTDRTVTKTFTITAKHADETNLVLEEGSSILIPIYSIHRDPKYFPEPEKFDPERFSVQNKDKFVSDAFMPFGMGPRTCIASRFAAVEVKLLVINILLHFDIVPIARTHIPMKMDTHSLNASPKDGMWLGFKKRY